MKEITWFIQRIGGTVKCSNSEEPLTVQNAAHAHRLFVSQGSDNSTFEDYEIKENVTPDAKPKKQPKKARGTKK